VIHRGAAIAFMLTILWHALYLTTRRGRNFLADMMPIRNDLTFMVQRLLFNLGLRRQSPPFDRFSYVEKAEYWALVWGTVIMVITGFMLWFDNWFIQLVPKGFLDVALVVHYWEAWLATLAILVWHLYSTVFQPGIYPMNPSWLTGTMPEGMYAHEHPAHLEAARKDTKRMIRKQIERVAWPVEPELANPAPDDEDEEEPPAGAGGSPPSGDPPPKGA
jgi:cytochrome b subunit of formate dehydrogenase